MTAERVPQTRLARASACLLCVAAETGTLLQAYTQEAKALEERYKRKEAEWEKQMDLLEEQQEQLERGVVVRSGPYCAEHTDETNVENVEDVEEMALCCCVIQQ